MKMKNPLIVVKDMDQSKFFYQKVLGLQTVVDLGANVMLTGGLALQTEESWRKFIEREVNYQGNDTEIYFEEDDFDAFYNKLCSIENIVYVHPLKEHTWGATGDSFL